MQMRGEAWDQWDLEMPEHLISTRKRGDDLEVCYRYLPMYLGQDRRR